MTDHEVTIARLEERIKALEKNCETFQTEISALEKLAITVEGAVTAIKYHWYLLGAIVIALIGLAIESFRWAP